MARERMLKDRKMATRVEVEVSIISLVKIFGYRSERLETGIRRISSTWLANMKMPVSVSADRAPATIIQREILNSQSFV